MVQPPIHRALMESRSGNILSILESKEVFLTFS